MLRHLGLPRGEHVAWEDPRREDLPRAPREGEPVDYDCEQLPEACGKELVCGCLEGEPCFELECADDGGLTLYCPWGAEEEDEAEEVTADDGPPAGAQGPARARPIPWDAPGPLLGPLAALVW